MILDRQTLAQITVLGLTEAIVYGDQPTEERNGATYTFNDMVMDELADRNLSVPELAGALGEIIGAILVTAGIMLAQNKEESLATLRQFSLNEATRND